ncbi:MAG: hypothetical protein ACOC83_03425 [Gemmatimonadota bacterium]
MREAMNIPKTIPRLALAALVAATVPLLSACSSLGMGGGSSSDRGAQMEVRVNNDHSGAERVTVSLMNAEGNRRSLGEVSAGERRSFDTSGDAEKNVRHRLMAESRRGETVLSPEIVVQEQSIVTWHIRDNQVEVYEAREKSGD